MSVLRVSSKIKSNSIAQFSPPSANIHTFKFYLIFTFNFSSCLHITLSPVAKHYLGLSRINKSIHTGEGRKNFLFRRSHKIHNTEITEGCRVVEWLRMSEHLRPVILLLLVVVCIVLVGVLHSLILLIDKFDVVVVGVEGVDLVEIILLILAVAPLLLPIAVCVLCGHSRVLALVAFCSDRIICGGGDKDAVDDDIVLTSCLSKLATSGRVANFVALFACNSMPGSLDQGITLDVDPKKSVISV